MALALLPSGASHLTSSMLRPATAPSPLERELAICKRQLEEAKRALAFRFADEEEKEPVAQRKTTYISDRMLQIVADRSAPDPEQLLLARELAGDDAPARPLGARELDLWGSVFRRLAGEGARNVAALSPRGRSAVARALRQLAQDDDDEGQDEDDTPGPGHRALGGKYDSVRILAALERLPPFELELLVDHWVKRIPQREMARERRMAQPSVFYRLQRAQARLAFFVEFPFSSEAIVRTLSPYTPAEHLIVLVTLWMTGLSKSETARALSITIEVVSKRVTQMRVALRGLGRRHRELRAYDDMFTRLTDARLWGVGREHPTPRNAKGRGR